MLFLVVGRVVLAVIFLRPYAGDGQPKRPSAVDVISGGRLLTQDARDVPHDVFVIAFGNVVEFL